MKKIKNYILSKEFIITLLIIAFMVFINIFFHQKRSPAVISDVYKPPHEHRPRLPHDNIHSVPGR